MVAPSLAVSPETFGAAPGEAKRPLNPISQRQIETVISRAVGGIGLVFALQTLPQMLHQMPAMKAGFGIGLALLLYGGIAMVVVATVTKFGIRTVTTFVAVTYLVAMIAWPMLVRDATLTLDGRPWLWYLCTVATSCAALAFPMVWAAIYTMVVPFVYGLVRLLPSGGGARLSLATLDVVYAMILGQVIVIIIFMLRHATAAVDVAQSNALHKYANAVRQHAVELERVQVDAIVHDSVLTTLLSAAAVSTPKEATLAASMAQQAIARLDDAGAAPLADEATIPFSRLSTRIKQTAATLSLPFTVSDIDVSCVAIPVAVSEALFSATIQAMLNSMQHAGPPDVVLVRSLTLRANDHGGCTIVITDSGIGFDPDAVPSGRLGLRISIMERVASVGGVAHIDTEVGQGTSVTLDWPDPENIESLSSQFDADLPNLELADYGDERTGRA